MSWFSLTIVTDGHFGVENKFGRTWTKKRRLTRRQARVPHDFVEFIQAYTSLALASVHYKTQRI